MADGTPNNTKAELLRGNIALETDTLRVALINDTTAYTFDPDAHEFVADVLDAGTTATEFGGTGYSRKDLTGSAIASDDAEDDADWTANDVEWSGLDDETIQGAIVYKQVGGDDTTPADDPIVQVYDDEQGDLANFPLPTNSSGIVLQFSTIDILSLEAL